MKETELYLKPFKTVTNNSMELNKVGFGGKLDNSYLTVCKYDTFQLEHSKPNDQTCYTAKHQLLCKC